MKLLSNQNLMPLETETQAQELLVNEAFSSVDHFVYREMEDSPVQSMNELERLSENIKTLSELNSRLSFVMKEVQYMLNIKKY
jgi:hypothetical protein